MNGTFVKSLKRPSTSRPLRPRAAEPRQTQNRRRQGFAAVSLNKRLLATARVRLYGEEFEVLSDPFPEAGGIAVQVKTKKDSNMRVLRLPSTVLHSVRGRKAKAA
jgi:hypothetical protein